MLQLRVRAPVISPFFIPFILEAISRKCMLMRNAVLEVEQHCVGTIGAQVVEKGEMGVTQVHIVSFRVRESWRSAILRPWKAFFETGRVSPVKLSSAGGKLVAL